MKVIFNSEQEEAVKRLTALRIIVGCMMESRNSRERSFECIDALTRLIGDDEQFRKMINTYHEYVNEDNLEDCQNCINFEAKMCKNVADWFEERKK